MKWTQEKLLDYLDEILPAHEAKRLIADLESDETLQKRLNQLRSMDNHFKHIEPAIPSPQLRERFYEFLDEYEQRQRVPEKKRSISWMQIAAGVFILVLSGFFLVDHFQTKKDLRNSQRQIAQIKESMFDQLRANSPAARIQAVNQTYQLSNQDQEVVGSLVEVLKFDESANVRLATLEALVAYSDKESLKQILVDLLPHEKDPSIQISMIQTLTQLKTESAVEPLENLLQRDDLLQDVKGEAQMSLYKLQSSEKM